HSKKPRSFRTRTCRELIMNLYGGSMNPVLRKWSVFLFVVGMGCAWAGCASSRNTSSPGANSERTPAQAENRGKVAFIFDENATEPRILAIESASGNVNVFVCVK